MNDNNLDRPKEIFFNYCSSKFQMMRDGFLSEYDKFNISEEQEEKWLTELIQRELNRLDINNTDTLFPLWHILQSNCTPSYIDNIIDFIETNLGKAQTKDNLTKFISKTVETIDRIDEGCKHKPLLIGKYKQRIEKLNKQLVQTDNNIK